MADSSAPRRVSRAAMRSVYIVRDAVAGLARNAVTNLAVVASVAVSLTLLGAAALVHQQVDLAAGEWAGNIEVSVFLCDGDRCPGGDEEQQRLRERLAADDRVDDVYFESQQQAYESFVERFADRPELVDAVDESTLPASFRLVLADPQFAPQVTADYADEDGVDEVVDQRDLLETFMTVSRAVQNTVLAVAGVQLAAAAALIANTVRVAAETRRDRSAIMRLLGASRGHVRSPFVLEGALAGLTGAALSVAALWASVPYLTGRAAAHVPFMPLVDLSHVAATAPLLVAVGVGIATAASWWTIRRHTKT